MKVVNVNGLENNPVKNVNQEGRESRVNKNSPLLPPFVLLGSASRNSGKSTMVVNLVKHIGQKAFDNIFIVCPTLFNQTTFESLNIPEENQYTDLDEDLNPLIKRVNEINNDYTKKKERIDELKMLLESGDGIINELWFQQYYIDDDLTAPDINVLRRKLTEMKRELKAEYPNGRPTHLIIFDDCQGSKALRSSRALQKMLIQHRHHQISLVFLTQSGTALPPYARNNPSAVALFNQKNEKEMKRIFEENLSMFDNEQLNELLGQLQSEPYQFLLFNFDKVDSNGLPEVRLNFNKIIKEI